MFDGGTGHGARGTARRSRPRGSRLLPLAACLVPFALSGCSAVLDTAAAVFGPGDIGSTVDAHVVYRLRPDCPALLARTISNGYTVLTPRDLAEPVPDLPEFVGDAIEETGVFEGPVRTGEVVFRYVPPAASETWASDPADVVADVDAVGLDLAAGSARIVALCGPAPETLRPDGTIPRIPGRPGTG